MASNERKRVVSVIDCVVEANEGSIRFLVRFDASDVILGEVPYLLSGKKSLVVRTLIGYGWMSETMEELFEHSTRIVFSSDRKSVDIICKKRAPLLERARILKEDPGGIRPGGIFESAHASEEWNRRVEEAEHC